MSTRRDFDDEREQREWDAQERALRAERGGAHAAGDASVAHYRIIARALRTPPLDALPADFAARTAARAERESRGEHLEVWLERGLVALLVLAGVGALLFFRDEPLLPLSFSLPERASFGIQTVLSWCVAIAACVGLSSAFAFARKH